ncbi:MAG: HAMP domain-containing sensor histidine kinase, partial [Bacteroidia bacterium]|nr:HAMP domain-containing sensor histidine kinase [Bacteroidia bacterium]
MKTAFFCLLMLPLLLPGQSRMDSAQTLLQGSPAGRTDRVIALARQWLDAEPPAYQDAALLLEQEKPADFSSLPPQVAGRYLALLGEACYIQRNTEGSPGAQAKAVEYYTASLPYLYQIGDSSALAKALLHLGSETMYADKRKALSYLETAARLYERLGDAGSLSACYVQIGTMLSDFGRKDEAMLYSRKALDLIRQLDNPALTMQTCINLGIVFSNAEAPEEAARLYDEAITVARRQQDTFMLAVALMYRGGLAVDQEGAGAAEREKGKQQLDEAQKLLESTDNEMIKKYLNVYLAAYYCSAGDYPQALMHSGEFVGFIRQTNMSEALASAWRQRGIIYERMGQADSARYYFQQMLAKGQETGTLPLISAAYETLYQLEKQQGNPAAALAYYEQYVVHHDSIYDQKLQDAIGAESVRLNLEGEQRARREAELQAQLLASRNLLYGAAALGLLAVLLVGGLLYRQLFAARKQLQRQNIQLRDLNATKDTFFGMIAHDLRNPISALEGVGEQMAYFLGRQDDAKLRRLADRVDTTARQLSALLDNLLSWALLQMGAIPCHPAANRLREVAAEAVALYQPAAEAKGVALALDIPEHLEVLADPNALHTILRNLISNALKFTPAGGMVRLNASSRDGRVYFEVNDTGVGISAEQLQRIFVPEYRSTRGTAGEKGSGLGLVLCRELVDRNLGTLEARSEAGRGAQFVVG